VRLPAALEPLATRDYRLVFTGAVLSNSGTWMQNMAVQWFIYQETGSAAWVGAATFAQFVPLFFAGPLGGVLADRRDRKRLLFWAQAWMMALSVVLAAVTLAGAATPELVIGLVLALGIGFAFNGPTWQAVVPHLVPSAQLTRAIALNSAQMSTARIVGPALGGLLVPVIGPGGIFALNAASYVAVLVAIALVNPPAHQPSGSESVTQQLRGGVRYALTHRVLAWLIAAVLVVSLLAAPLMALLPVYAEDVLQAGPETYGILMAAIGGGSLLGALLLGQFGDRLPTARLIGGALVLLGVATALVPVASLAPGPTLGVALTALAVLATGTFRLGAVAASNSRLQARADDAYRGRVLSLFLICFGGAFPLGALLLGNAADVVGVQPVTLLMGIGTLLGGLLVGNRLAVHDRGVPEAAPQGADDEPAPAPADEPAPAPAEEPAPGRADDEPAPARATFGGS